MERQLKTLWFDEMECRANNRHSVWCHALRAPALLRCTDFSPKHELLPGDLARLCPTATGQHTVLQQSPETRLCCSRFIVDPLSMNIKLPDPLLPHTGTQYYNDQFSCHPHYTVAPRRLTLGLASCPAPEIFVTRVTGLTVGWHALTSVVVFSAKDADTTVVSIDRLPCEL